MRKIYLLLALFIGVFASAQTPTYTHSTKVKIETVDEELTPTSNTQVLVRDSGTNELKYIESADLIISPSSLQEVTDIGATTTNNITIDNGSDNGTLTLGTTNTTTISWDDFPANGDFTINSDGNTSILSNSLSQGFFMDADGVGVNSVDNGTTNRAYFRTTNLTAQRRFELPDIGADKILPASVNGIFADTSGDITVIIPDDSPFEIIDEGSGNGIIKRGRDPLDFGPVGLGAFDISNSLAPSSTFGATGADSFAQGVNTTASGSQSAALNGLTISSGNRSFSANSENTAPSFAESVFGTYSTEYVPSSASLIVSTDRLFNIGNGTSTGTRADAFTIIKDGTPTFPSLTNTLIDNEVSGRVALTREWFEANSSSSGTYQTVFINTASGNDLSGELGNPALPYATLQAAIDDFSGTGENPDTFVRFWITDNETYELNNEVQGFINMEIYSPYSCTISFDNNVNTNFFFSTSPINDYLFYINMPNGTITKDRSGGAGVVISSTKHFCNLNIKEIIDNSNDDLFTTRGRFFVEKLDKLTSNGTGFLTKIVSNDIYITTVEVNNSIHNPIIVSPIRMNAGIVISEITGTGGFEFKANSADLARYTVGDISTTLQSKVNLVSSTKNCSIHFDESIITTATGIKLGESAIGNVTITGTIRSSPKIETVGSNNGHLKFKNFVGDFGAGLLVVGTAMTLTIENSSIKADGSNITVSGVANANAVTMKNVTYEHVTPGSLTTGGTAGQTVYIRGVNTNATTLVVAPTVLVQDFTNY